MKLDATYWESRYTNQATGWDLGRVSRPMRHIIDGIADRSAEILIPGAGYGYEALYLVEKGFTNITVLDLASSPLNRLEEMLPTNSSVRLLHEDFFEHEGKYHLILEQTFFCALELRFRESYAKKMHELLLENGVLKGVFFNFYPQRSEPPFTATLAVYRTLFKDLFKIVHLSPSLHSEPERTDKELYIELKKR